MDMKFRTASGAIVSANPLADAPTPVSLANPATERGVGQVEPAHLLRKQIESVIGVVRRNPRNFRQPSSSPATSASRSMNLPSVWKV